MDLDNHRYKFVIKKGMGHIEKWRAIKGMTECSGLWCDLVSNTKPGKFLFSVGLVPGHKSVRPDRIGRRSKKWVLDNENLGINATFYQFKHSNLTEISSTKGAEVAAAGADHHSAGMVIMLLRCNKVGQDS